MFFLRLFSKYLEHVFYNQPANSSYLRLKLLQKLQMNPTVVSNGESSKNDFNDFKIGFPVKKSDFT